MLSGGRAFVGVGEGWWERERVGHGLAFPPAGECLDALERGIETVRALWAPGAASYDGARVALPDTTSYPRPVGSLRVVVGGTGRRTLRIAATLGDAADVPAALPALDDAVSTRSSSPWPTSSAPTTSTASPAGPLSGTDAATSEDLTHWVGRNPHRPRPRDAGPGSGPGGWVGG